MALLWDGEDLRFYLDGKARPDRDIAGQRYQQQPQDEEQKLRDIVTKGVLQKSLLGAFYDLDEGAGGFFRGIIDDVRISRMRPVHRGLSKSESLLINRLESVKTLSRSRSHTDRSGNCLQLVSLHAEPQNAIDAFRSRLRYRGTCCLAVPRRLIPPPTNRMTNAPPAARTPTSLRYRLCVMMFLQYFVQGSYLPVITEYLRSGLEFTPSQIGTFSAAIAVGPLVAPFFFGQLVDRHLATEKVLAICHLCGGAIMLALYSIEAYVPIVLLGVLYSTLYVPSMMLTNSLSFQHLADREREFPLIRLWGTIGFVVPAWWVEMVFLRGLEGPPLDKARGIVLAFAGFGGLVMGLYCLTLPHTPPAKSDKKDLAPGKVLHLLRHRNFAVLVGVSLIVAIVHKHYFVWAAPFLRTVLDSVGIEAAIEGRIMSLGQIAEVVVFALLGLLLKGLGFKRVMLIGAFAYLLRCALFAAAIMIPGGEAQFAAESWAMQLTANGPAKLIFALLALGQMLHGLCFGCFLAAGYIYVDKVAPADVRGSMQTFYGTFIVGAGLFLGGFVSGWLGAIFETLPREITIRAAIGIPGTAGLVEYTRTAGGQPSTLVADWPAIWLSGGAIALVAMILFAVLFPGDGADTLQSTP